MPIILPCLDDNYAFLIPWDGQALVIDPGESGPVIESLGDKCLKVILITHNHQDHVEGVKKLKKQTGAKVLGADTSIPCLDDLLQQESSCKIGPFSVQVLSTPGHSKSHVCYYFSSEKWLFCGDVLFSGGCGRVFTGDYQQAHRSLQKLANLPEETKVYCGHEYTRKNLAFYLSIVPGQKDVENRLKELQNTACSLPSTIANEKKINPFLKTRDREIRESLKMQNASDLEVFIELRKRRDAY